MLRNVVIYVVHSRVDAVATVQVLLGCAAVQADKIFTDVLKDSDSSETSVNIHTR